MADGRRLRAPLPRPGTAAGRRKKRLKARAEWHFGGGPTYCAGCAATGQPCAKGEPGAKPATVLGPVGRACPYREHEPRTLAGWQAWDVIARCSGQLRLAPNAAMVIGIDMTAALAIGAALGHDLHSLAELLPAGEAGLVAAINKHLDTST